MATKFGTKSAISRLVYKISRRSLCITWGFRCRAIEWCVTNSTATDPHCHGNRIWDKIGYISACMKDISEILASNAGFTLEMHAPCIPASCRPHAACCSLQHPANRRMQAAYVLNTSVMQAAFGKIRSAFWNCDRPESCMQAACRSNCGHLHWKAAVNSGVDALHAGFMQPSCRASMTPWIYMSIQGVVFWTYFSVFSVSA